MSSRELIDDHTKSMCTSEHASPDDLQKLFASEMTELFGLAFLLTANAEKAEQCVLRSMHECMDSGVVLKGWLYLWARNVVIQNGIKLVLGIHSDSFVDIAQYKPVQRTDTSLRCALSRSDYSAGILELSDFDRLVYVICVLERYASVHCALLLGRSRREIRDARKRALADIAKFESSRLCAACHSRSDHNLPTDDQGSEFDGTCGHLLA